VSADLADGDSKFHRISAATEHDLAAKDVKIIINRSINDHKHHNSIRLPYIVDGTVDQRPAHLRACV